MRPKVVHITTVHEPYDTRIYHKECLSLKNAGFDVYLIAAVDGNIRTDGVKIIPIKKRRHRISRMIMSAYDAYRQAKKLQADIYHFHDPELLLTGKLLMKKNNHVIYDIHEDYETSISQKHYLKKPVRKLAAKIYNVVESFLIKGMQLCLAEKYYSEKYPKGKQILNYPILTKERGKSFSQHHTATNDKVIYTGNVTDDRGAAFHANIPNIDNTISVHFIGKCAKSIADKMQKIAGENSDRLCFNGIGHYVEREVIDKAYQQNWLAGLALFPPTAHYKKKELTKFFEYMAAGIPIVCSDFPVWKKFISEYDCGITVNPYDEKQIAEAVSYLKSNPQSAKEMGKNGKLAIQNKLNWQCEAEKLITWYKELLLAKRNRVKS